MAFNINKEVKIGLLLVVTLVALFFGLRFLQGKGLFQSGTDVVAFYENTNGLNPSAPVMLKGVAVGKVREIELLENEKVMVHIYLKKGIILPVGTEAQLASQSVISGEKMIALKLAHSSERIKDGDTLIGRASTDLFDNLSSEVSPMMTSVNSAVTNIDSLILSMNEVLNARSKLHLQNTFENLDASMVQINKLVSSVNQQTAALSKIMNNASTFTNNLATNNERVNRIMANAEKATQSLTGPEIKQTLTSLQGAARNINTTIEQISNSNGTFGKLVNDQRLYDSLTLAAGALNSTLRDIKSHPAKYINLSVFPSKQRTVIVEKEK